MPQRRRHEMGSGGFCVCTKCGEKIPHRRGVPCQDELCPKCGTKLLREGSYHHQLWKKGKSEEGLSS
ncbi:MAG: ferredoxin [Ignavibacteriales bacterium CG07_land_8_20_14_0_80_59_12]|nr:MAG: ferredoxin [Ignavibacteriales bacterium CG07_land_8_20_14_0_80_59_12]